MNQLTVKSYPQEVFGVETGNRWQIKEQDFFFTVHGNT
jgi:hypothetical protein